MKTYQYVVSIDHLDGYDRIGADLTMAAIMEDTGREWDSLEGSMGRPLIAAVQQWVDLPDTQKDELAPFVMGMMAEWLAKRGVVARYDTENA